MQGLIIGVFIGALLNSTRIICITTHALRRDLECTPKLSTRVTISWLFARATTYQKVCARIECSTKLASTMLRVLHQKNAHSRSTNTFQTFPMKTTASPDRVQKTRSRGSSSLSSAQGDPTNNQKTLAGTARQSNGMWSILQRSTREEAGSALRSRAKDFCCARWPRLPSNRTSAFIQIVCDSYNWPRHSLVSPDRPIMPEQTKSHATIEYDMQQFCQHAKMKSRWMKGAL